MAAAQLHQSASIHLPMSDTCSSHRFRTTICLPFVLIEMHNQEERTWKHRSHNALTYHLVYVPNVLTNGVLCQVVASP